MLISKEIGSEVGFLILYSELGSHVPSVRFDGAGGETQLIGDLL